jgi:hypothetical protein
LLSNSLFSVVVSSLFDSSIVPSTGPLGSPRNCCNSATAKTDSSNLSIFVFYIKKRKSIFNFFFLKTISSTFKAEIGTPTISPPIDSSCRPCSASIDSVRFYYLKRIEYEINNLFLYLTIFASALSILLIATTIGTIKNDD